MEPVKDGQRHADMSDDSPCPDAKDSHVFGPKGGPPLDECVNYPETHVCHQQKRDILPAGLFPCLRLSLAPLPPGAHYKQCLQDRLHNRKHFS